ncbi:MAG: hypothetical protein L0H53_08495 [Candidatus Nitrosocosmicus sp.]|nr:hypothetical protein [Candidatus Nitrosocosmicus sp.]
MKRPGRFLLLIVFTIGCIIRIIPEIFAYPYPIGYDVINYYIPVIHNFEEKWSTVSSQFPLYVSLQYFFHKVSGFSEYQTVVIFAVISYGVFAVILYVLSRQMLKLDFIYSIFLTVFVLFQIPVLRTTWDLHRDIFAVSGMLLSLFFASLMEKGKNQNWVYTLLFIISSCIVVLSDRMIGALLIISLISYSSIKKDKTILLFSTFLSVLFVLQIILGSSITPVISNITSSFDVSAIDSTSNYNPRNLFLLFMVINGSNIATGIIGYFFMKDKLLLKLPLLITIFLSFSWLSFPDNELLVADRWIILNGIFLSIFSAYGLLKIIDRVKTKFTSLIGHISSNNMRIITFFILSTILTIFVSMGIYYETSPYGHPLPILGITRDYIEYFVPITMQFSSLDVDDNDELQSAISWINNNTKKDAVVVGDKHWRGLMELNLDDSRSYLFSSKDSREFVHDLRNSNNSQSFIYLLDFTSSKSNSTFLIKAYSNEVFSIFAVR